MSLDGVHTNMCYPPINSLYVCVCVGASLTQLQHLHQISPPDDLSKCAGERSGERKEKGAT